MSLDRLNPFLRFARILTATESFCTFRICYDCRLFCITTGEGTLTVGDETFELSRGTAVYLPPQSRYRFSYSVFTELQMIVLNFDLVDEYCRLKDSLRIATDETFDPAKCPQYELPTEFAKPFAVPHPAIGELMLKIVQDHVNYPSYYREMSSARLKLALLTMLEYRTKTELGGRYEMIANTKTFIQEHYPDAELTNAGIATAMGYHPYYLNRLFKDNTGQTLRQYLSEYRIRQACRMLTETNEDVLSIAESCGFGGSSYFIKRFKESIGVTPLKYRAMSAEYS